MDDDYHQRVLRFSNESGFPFQLKLGARFRAANFHVYENVYYLDDDEGKPREIDFYVYNDQRIKISDLEVLAGSILSVEAKTNKNHPWVVFSSLKNNDVYEKESLPVSIGGRINGNIVLKEIQEFIYSTHPSFKHPRLGRSVLAAFKKNGQDIEEGAQGKIYRGQELGAVLTVSKASASEAARISSDTKYDHIMVMRSLVVLSSDLFEYYLDNSGEGFLEKTDYLPVLFHYESKAYQTGTRLIEIVTERGLEKLIDTQNEWSESFKKFLSSSLRIPKETERKTKAP